MATIRRRSDRWQVQVRRTGQSPISKSFTKKPDALTWARKMEAAADRGELANTHSGPITTRTILERYRDEITPKNKGASVETYRINALLRAKFVDIEVRHLSPSLLSAYRDARLKQVTGPSVRREINLLSRAYTVARKEWAWPVSNPLDDILKPADSKPRDRRLEAGERERLLLALGQCRNPWITPAVKLALETGMRRGELLRARWEHLDTTKKTLLIPETKNGHPRTIPLSPEALALLESIPRHISGRVIPLTPVALRHAWDRALRRADIEDLHFHDLRHEAISRFFERGLNVPEVALISGHRDYRMLFRYTHLRPEDVARKLT